jgi:hypothetical protein
MRIASKKAMEWLTSFPSFYWQRGAFAMAMVVLIIAMLMAVRPRSRKNRAKPI